MPILKCDDVSLDIRGKKLLSNVSFELKTGQFVLLAGSNGAGKSTLLKCLMQLISRWTGKMTFEGKDVRTYSQRQLAQKIAYLPQRLEALPDFTVRHFMKVCRYAWNDEGNEQIQRAAEELGISHFLERALPTLSGGELQKVLLASALAQQPRLMLLDEPSAALDPLAKEEILRTIADLSKRQEIAVLMSSHDVAVAAKYVDGVFPMKQGQLLPKMTGNAFLKQMDTIYVH